MRLDEYASYDALGLAELVRKREISAPELCRVALAALDAVNPELNAVIARLPDWEERLAAQPTGGRFYGVPFLIKDLVLHLRGAACDMGSRLVKGAFVSPHDTDLARRFLATGVVPLGRTNTPEMGFNASTEPVLYGPTRNPWNPAHSAGGSSGGSAAAVAAGIVPMAHANDGGGSIRIPAANCGLVGLKPTRGRTPVGPEFGEPLHGMGIEHVVTRTVRDAAAMLDDVEGPGVGDRFVIPRPERPYREEVKRPPRKLRVAYTWAGMMNARVDPACIRAVEDTARLLASQGHDVAEDAPAYDEAAFHTANFAYWCGFLAFGVTGFVQATGVEPTEQNLEAATWACYRHGLTLRMLDGELADFLTNTVCRAVGEFFSRYDVLLSPVLAGPPLPLGVLDQNAPRGAREWYDFVFGYAPFTALYNMTGQPAISLPLHQTADGLPIGVQLVGRFGDEATLLRVAGRLEEAVPWAARIPPVHVSRAGKAAGADRAAAR